jgi:hypothetical protein
MMRPVRMRNAKHSPKAPSQQSGWSQTRPTRVVEDLTNKVPAINQPVAGNLNEQHDELIKMIEGQSKSLYQFGLMLTASTVSPNRKQAAINHLLANLETKRFGKNQIGGEEATIRRTNLALFRATAKTKHPW